MVLTYNVQTITSTTTVGGTVDTLFVNPPDDNATINVSLPAITADGQRYLIKRIDSTAATVFILPNGSDTVAGSSTQSISAGQVVELVSISSSTNWEYVMNIAI
jgi:hypothetical protein